MMPSKLAGSRISGRVISSSSIAPRADIRHCLSAKRTDWRSAPSCVSLVINNSSTTIWHHIRHARGNPFSRRQTDYSFSDVAALIHTLETKVLQIIGAVIAMAGLWIAWEQKRLTDLRFRHDTYERRYRFYQAAKALLVTVQDNATLSTPDYLNYLRGIAGASFCLDNNAVDYLETLRMHALELIRVAKPESADNEAAEIRWFLDQFPMLDAIFKESLDLNAPSLTEDMTRLGSKLMQRIKILNHLVNNPKQH